MQMSFHVPKKESKSSEFPETKRHHGDGGPIEVNSIQHTDGNGVVEEPQSDFSDFVPDLAEDFSLVGRAPAAFHSVAD